MDDDNSDDGKDEKKLPPVDGMDYPEKPGEDASAMEKMQWMEQVDRYWQKRGFQKLENKQEEEESTDEQG